MLKTKNLEARLSGGIAQHHNGTFTLYGYIDNIKSKEELGMHKCTYQGYTIKDAITKFKIELKDILELCEEDSIFTNDDWLTFNFPHKARD
tara:strand:+ start:543 stop:815 length:273 start_codon:yes stop_codon:yes gene_type:complete